MIQTIKKFYIYILLIIFGGVVLHAPITVALSSIFPQYSLLIKSWKEILMLVAGLMALYIIFKTKQLKFFSDPLIIAIIVYAAIHLFLLSYRFQGANAALAGVAIDLRYLLFFGLVYLVMHFSPEKKNTFIKVGIIGALIVGVFAILQVFLLPHDVLKYIGYSDDTIVPFLLIDKNTSFVRINSTLRGPNPLGAYAMMVLTLVSAVIVKKKGFFDKRKKKYLAAILIIGGLVALWASYSRSAWLATLASILTVIIIATSSSQLKKKWLAIGIGFIGILAILAITIGGKTFISNVILHENPNGGSSFTSNTGHINSVWGGIRQMVGQPIGAGVGSTGSASLFTQKPEVIENQYLFIAHEVGWLGLLVFVCIFMLILTRLYIKRNDWLAIGVFASGIGLAVIGLLLPVWVDDTVSIVWWGLAALALTPIIKGAKNGKATIN